MIGRFMSCLPAVDSLTVSKLLPTSGVHLINIAMSVSLSHAFFSELFRQILQMREIISVVSVVAKREIVSMSTICCLHYRSYWFVQG